MGRYFSKEVSVDEAEIVNAVKQWAYPLQSKADLQPLFDRIGDARIVMPGEAGHGTVLMLLRSIFFPRIVHISKQ